MVTHPRKIGPGVDYLPWSSIKQGFRTATGFTLPLQSLICLFHHKTKKMFKDIDKCIELQLLETFKKQRPTYQWKSCLFPRIRSLPFRRHDIEQRMWRPLTTHITVDNSRPTKKYVGLVTTYCAAVLFHLQLLKLIVSNRLRLPWGKFTLISVFLRFIVFEWKLRMKWTDERTDVRTSNTYPYCVLLGRLHNDQVINGN